MKTWITNSSLLLGLIILCLSSFNSNAQSCSDGTYSFEDDISPVLTFRCQSCHTVNNTSGFNLSSYSNLLMGGNNCGPGVVAGNAEASSLYEVIKFVIGEGDPNCAAIMPPATANNELTASEVNMIFTWIEQGAQQFCPVEVVLGCTDANACNFTIDATEDDGTCLFINEPCDDDNADTQNDVINQNCECMGEQVILIEGCTDETACSFNPDATEDNGTCVYIGDACDDGNPNTENDMLSGNCECTGVVGFETVNQILINQVFPIPVTNQLNINFTLNTFEPTNLKIFNSLGKLISQFTTTNQQHFVVEINEQAYANGLYFLHLSNSNGNAIQKFIVQN